MNITYVDTKSINDIGKEIIDLANEYNIEITNLFKRITNIPYDTQEWTGNKALKYSEIISLDKQQYLDFYNLLKEFANELIRSSESAENCIKITQEEQEYDKS